MKNKFTIKDRIIIVGISAILLAIMMILLYIFHLIDNLVEMYIASLLGSICYQIIDAKIIQPYKLKKERKFKVSQGGENVKFGSSKVFQLNKLTKN